MSYEKLQDEAYKIRIQISYVHTALDWAVDEVIARAELYDQTALDRWFGRMNRRLARLNAYLERVNVSLSAYEQEFARFNPVAERLSVAA